MFFAQNWAIFEKNPPKQSTFFTSETPYFTEKKQKVQSYSERQWGFIWKLYILLGIRMTRME
jgi:hypothetical protein